MSKRTFTCTLTALFGCTLVVAPLAIAIICTLIGVVVLNHVGLVSIPMETVQHAFSNALFVLMPVLVLIIILSFRTPQP